MHPQAPTFTSYVPEDPAIEIKFSLMEAIYADSVEFLDKSFQKFLDKGIDFDINSALNDGENALMIAATFNRTNVLENLIQRGADIKLRAKDGYQATHFACSSGSVEALNILRQIDASVVNDISNNAKSPLHLAVINGHLDVVQHLLDHGADIKHRGNLGYQAVHYACRSGSVEILDALTQKDASVVHDMYSYTTQHVMHETYSYAGGIHIAAGKGHLNIVNYLLNHGADINAVTSSGNSALIIAVENEYTNISHYLLDQEDVDVNIVNAEGFTALHKVAWLNDDELFSRLVDAGGRVDMVSNTGYLPIDLTTNDSIIDMITDRMSQPISSTSSPTATNFSASHTSPNLSSFK